MSRAPRLLDLIQILRNHRFPITGKKLAEGLGISLRTVYRDIATLQEQGANIEGEPGLGYVLKPGFLLPPLMFSEEEIEALVLGSQWVADQGDIRLASAARTAIQKIAAVLSPDLRHALDSTALLPGPLLTGQQVTAENNPSKIDSTLPMLRLAIRNERKIKLIYRDQKGEVSERTIWPFALGFFERVRVLVAWCELRNDIRHFRTDRIETFTLDDQRYPKRRQILLKEWKTREGIPTDNHD